MRERAQLFLVPCPWGCWWPEGRHARAQRNVRYSLDTALCSDRRLPAGGNVRLRTKCANSPDEIAGPIESTKRLLNKSTSEATAQLKRCWSLRRALVVVEPHWGPCAL